MNISDVFKYDEGTMFRIPEDDKFDEEFVEIVSRRGIKILIDERGNNVSLSEAYLKADYIKKNN